MFGQKEADLLVTKLKEKGTLIVIQLSQKAMAENMDMVALLNEADKAIQGAMLTSMNTTLEFIVNEGKM